MIIIIIMMMMIIIIINNNNRLLPRVLNDNNDDDDDDDHYRWLLQNEIDSTVDVFVQQIGTVVTRYEEKFLPFFSGTKEERELHSLPEGLRAC